MTGLAFIGLSPAFQSVWLARKANDDNDEANRLSEWSALLAFKQDCEQRLVRDITMYKKRGLTLSGCKPLSRSKLQRCNQQSHAATPILVQPSLSAAVQAVWQVHAHEWKQHCLKRLLLARSRCFFHNRA